MSTSSVSGLHLGSLRWPGTLRGITAGRPVGKGSVITVCSLRDQLADEAQRISRGRHRKVIQLLGNFPAVNLVIKRAAGKPVHMDIMPCRRCVWSSSTPLRRHESHLGAASHVHHPVGSRAFSVAAPLIWNSLPDDVISAESLPTFQRKLKRRLLCQLFHGFCY